MADNKEIVLPPYDLEAKYDACLDLTLRRFVRSSLVGVFGAMLFFRSPVTRWASVAFGAGVGIGSAYTECSRLFDGSPTKSVPSSLPPPPPPPQISESPKISETTPQDNE
ncbi:hypothetical protein L6164_023691 [Bauhinia variegata]|uniref:Uncharacterized protein n=1 Tax=Bauhinia variegata TaxID=167791 RepID=A0ACB9ML33_BAUVA|nr:hypothetical protein L6164_023691 [Bauhinia variegata]